jgi:membrane protease subunit (stomatin/prohibitin family)
LWPLTNDVPFVDMAAHQAPLAQKITGHAARRSRRYIGMNMVGDLGRYAQFEAAQAIPIAAANEGGAAGVGVGLGAGISMAQTMMNAMKPAAQPGGAPGASGETKFCVECGHAIPKTAKFCAECGKAQQ